MARPLRVLACHECVVRGLQQAGRPAAGPRPLVRVPRERAACQANLSITSRQHDSSTLARAAPDDRQGAQSSQDSGQPSTSQQGAEAEGQEKDSPAIRAALSALDFYRNVISPMMPSSCRYVPSCSQYSIQSYKQYGLWKGTVLTAWRILRCNPWASSGFDPPAWPPKGLAMVYRSDGDVAAQFTVALGLVLAWWVLEGLWEGVAPIVHYVLP